VLAKTVENARVINGFISCCRFYTSIRTCGAAFGKQIGSGISHQFSCWLRVVQSGVRDTKTPAIVLRSVKANHFAMCFSLFFVFFFAAVIGNVLLLFSLLFAHIFNV